MRQWQRKRRVPVILQGEISECGLACLAMIFQYYGFNTTLHALRQRGSVSLKGMSAAHMIHLAQQCHFDAKAYRLDVNQLRTLQWPAVLHWDMNHFVVLVKVEKRYVIVHDPAYGRCKLTWDAVSEHFTGIAIELAPTEKTVLAVDSDDPSMTLSQWVVHWSELKSTVVRLFGLAIGLQVLTLASPQCIQAIIDAVSATPAVSYLLFLTLIFAGLKLLEAGIGLIRAYYVVYAGAKLNQKLAHHVFTQLIHLPISYFEKRYTGDVISRFSSIHPIREFLTHRVVETFLDGLLSLATLVIMGLYNVGMLLVVLLSTLVYCGIRCLMFSQFKYMNEKNLKLHAYQHTHLIESIRGLLPIKIFGKEHDRQKVWEQSYVNYLNAHVKKTQWTALFENIKNTSFSLELVVVIFIGACLLLDHRMTMGMLYAFLFYRTQFTAAIGRFIDNALDYKMLGLHLDRLADITAQTPEKPSRQSVSLNTRFKTLALKNVSFQYAAYEPYVIRHVNCKISAGERIVLTAPSGYGKTTLLKLMMGLLVPTEGEIIVNGCPLDPTCIRSYRQKLASVMQGDTLFSGSILDNITFFDAAFSFDRAQACAKIAQIHQTIMAFPMQYHTLIGDMGTVLSEGQKQRVLLARALYRQPELLILDEAMSHVDIATEMRIYEAMQSLNITQIVVSHRQETLQRADRVINLQDLYEPGVQVHA